MTRPNLGQLAPGATVSVSGNNRTVTSGNPVLDPFRAKAYDVVDRVVLRSRVAAVGSRCSTRTSSRFVPDVRADQRPFTGNPLGLPDSVAIAACGATAGCSAAAIWDFTVPANTEGGELKGFEISYQQPFSFLPGVWSNFGTILNYTGVESEIDVPDRLGRRRERHRRTTTSRVSRQHAYNATLYFDNKMFSARVSAAYRSEYLTTVPGRDGNDVEGTAETMNIDFSATYNINDNFSVSLEALNLTDEVQDQWVDSIGDRLSFYHHQGTQFYLGARFKY